MTEHYATIMTFLHDPKAVAVVLGLFFSTAIAFLSISKSESKPRRTVLYSLMVAAFLLATCAAWLQHKDAKRDERLREQAEEKTEQIKKYAQIAAVSIEDLAKLNSVSPSARYHIRLSTNPDAAKACKSLRAIATLFPGADQTKSIRVVKRASYTKEPYVLIFGNALTLASAEIYQRLALAHALSNGLPPIEREDRDEEIACSPVK